MNAGEQQHWFEKLSRRPLTEAERAGLARQLAEDPSRLDLLRQEDALARLLAELPQAPVPGNFVARVQAAIDLEEARAERSRRRSVWGLLRGLAPKLAVGGAVALLALLAHLQYRSAVRENVASSLATIGPPLAAAVTVAQLPAADVLRDYDLIHALQRTSVLADRELLAALAPEPAIP